MTTVTTLFSVVSPFSLTISMIYNEIKRGRYLSEDTRFTSFILSDFMDSVFSAVFAFAVGTTSLGNVDYNISFSSNLKEVVTYPL